jgi:2-keto-3-deoxy-L-rhamnonate aldolase RhmA
LWAEGRAAFGVFVPDERPRPPRGQRREGAMPQALYTVEGGERLGRNPLYDYLFLNLESGYDRAAVEAIAGGLEAAGAAGRMALLVRIPPIERDGEQAARQRVVEILTAGADGVVFPHVRGPEEAALAVSMLIDAGADVWSPANPDGDKIAMIMIEDPESLARVQQTSQVPGISILACGIGSLRGALGGDREAAEAGNQQVLSQARRIGVPDMLTADVDDVEQRVREGFLALLMQGDGADEAIRVGRQAAGR